MPGPGIEVFIGGNPAKLKAALADAKRSVDDFSSNSKKSLESIEKFAVPAAAAFAGIAIGIGASVKAFADFEASLNQIKAVSGATASQMAALKAQALQLGKDTQFSAKQAADAMGELAKAGFTVEQTMAAIPGVMSLAAAGGLSVAEAAEAAGEALNGFSLGADESQRVADLLAQAANVSAVSVQDLSESMKFIAPVAASTSQSIEEVSTVLAIMGNAGIKGSQGGTAIRQALASLVKPSDDAANTMHKLGISISDTNGKVLPLSDIIGQLREKTANLSEAQRANAISTIFGTEAMSGILAVMKQTPAQVEAVAAQFRNVDGAAADMARTMNGGFKGAMDSLSGSVETLGTQMGEALAPAILLVANGLKAAVDAISDLDPSTKALIAGVTVGAAALAAFAAAAGAIAAALPLVATGLAVVNLSLGPVGIAIAALAGSIGLVTWQMAQMNAQTQQTKAELDKEKTTVNGLVAEYEALRTKTNLTAAEKKRMQDILNEINKVAPKVITGYDNMGNALGVSRIELDKYNTALDHQINLLYEAAQAERDHARAQTATAKVKLADIKGEVRDLEKKLSDAKVSASSSLDPTGRTIRAENLREVQSLEAALANARERLSEQAGIVSSSQSAYNDRYRRKPTGKGGGGNGGGGSGRDRGAVVSSAGSTSSASSDAAQEIRDIEAISEAYREAAQTKRENVQSAANLAVDTFNKEMDAELEAIAAALEADDEATQKKIQNAKLATDEAARLGEELVKQQLGKTIRDVQGDITALGIDPSLERVANFAKGLADDDAELEGYADAVRQIGNEFELAGGGAQGFGAAISAVATNINPVSIALTVVAGLALKIADSFTQAAAAQKRSLEMIREMQGAIADADIALEDDPVKKAILIRNKAISDGQAEFNKTLEERRKALYEQSIAFVNADASASTADKAQRIRDLDSQFKVGTGIFSEESLAQGDEVVSTAKTLFERIKDQAEKTLSKTGGASIGGFIVEFGRKVAAGMAAEVQAALDVVEKQNEAQRELDQGGRNERGEKVSLAVEKQLALDKQRAANQKTLNGLTERKVKLEQELTDLQEDTAKRIADIENEGIAVRSRTEFQDKSVRIAKVKEDAEKRRLELVDGVADIEGDIKDAQIEASNALARINVQYQERITKLTDEIGKQQKILDLMNEQAVAAARTAASAQAAATYSSGGSSSSTFLGYADGASVRQALAGMTGAATGGIVAGGIKGKDSVPMLTMPGELIVDNPLTKGLETMVQYVLGSRGSGGPVPAMTPALAGGGPVNIAINVSGTGHDPRSLSRMIGDEVGRAVRRTRRGM